MDNETNKHEDQAAQLKKIFDEVQQGSKVQEENEVENQQFENLKPNKTREIDILNLPPRKEIHDQSKNRTRLKIGRPFRRLLLVIIILIIVIVGAYFLWGEDLVLIINSL